MSAVYRSRADSQMIFTRVKGPRILIFNREREKALSPPVAWQKPSGSFLIKKQHTQGRLGGSIR